MNWLTKAVSLKARKNVSAIFAIGVLLVVGNMLFSVPARAETNVVSPGQSIQKVIDQSEKGDVIVLKDGVYQEVLNVKIPVTLKAEHGGEAIITNRQKVQVTWSEKSQGSGIWYAGGIDWPVHRLLVEGRHAFDYRNKENFDKLEVGPFWSKGWQAGKWKYTVPMIYFAHDSSNNKLWLKLNDGHNPNEINIDFNSDDLDGTTLVQKDLGTYWNQQEIVVISKNPPVHPITHWYGGTKEKPKSGRKIDFPKICGIVIEINADSVTLEGLRIHMAPTVGVEVNNSKNVTIQDCYFSGYQFAINTGYECTNLIVTHCEMDGGELVSFGHYRSRVDDRIWNPSVDDHMWNSNTYIVPVKFNGTGLTFTHNYVYEGFDLFQPRGRHKDFTHVPDLRSKVAYNVWQNAIDNAIEFDGVEARMNMRFHHNLIIQDHDALAITTTENGGPLTIDHNIWWPGGGRIMKLGGTGRQNNGVQFIHNTYFTGSGPDNNRFGSSIFENNIIISRCNGICWTPETLGSFFPTPYNLLEKGHLYTRGFEGLTADACLGQTPTTRFVLQQGSPAINSGIAKEGYYQDNVRDSKPDLGALEYGQTIEDWRKEFGHCGPRWITVDNAVQKAPHRPRWPEPLDRRWGGMN